MKRYIFSLLFLLPVSFAAAQTEAPVMPDLISATGEQTSMADILKKVMATPQTKVVTENTEQTVKSAIDGALVFDETVPEVNQEVVEAIDPKTKRYPPRIQLNFKEFPLIKIKNTVPDAEDTDTFADTNLHQTDLIVSRIRQRTKQDGINIVFKGRTAVLSGTAASQRQIELAEAMLRFEPGVDIIENKMTAAK